MDEDAPVYVLHFAQSHTDFRLPEFAAAAKYLGIPYELLETPSRLDILFGVEVEQRCDLLQAQELFPDVSEGGLRGEVGCYGSQVAVETDRTKLCLKSVRCIVSRT